MKLMIAMDSFKGTLSSGEAGNTVKDSFLSVFPQADIEVLPVADGGEGTIQAIISCTGGAIRHCEVTGPLGDPVNASYGRVDDMAIIEMAQASGLILLEGKEANPLAATSYGTGQLIQKALKEGAKKIIIGIGGSATNDGGAGMAQALGARFFDSKGRELPLGGAGLKGLDRIDLSNMERRLYECEVLVACDVNNLLCGPEGASYVYGPQKGADAGDVLKLDKALCRLAEVAELQLGTDFAGIPGAGAAGGLGFGLMAFCNAELKSGIELILELSGIEEKIKSADLVITGEGCMDDQVRNGKAPMGISRMAGKYGVPVIALAGQVKATAGLLNEMGIRAALATINTVMEMKEIKSAAREQLAFASLNAARLIRLGSEIKK